MDAFMLARLQFALNISFHILFPSITIALAWILFFFRTRWCITRDEAWLNAYRLWTKVFALSFALGVVSGIPMSLQFGSNWPGFMERAGNIAGPLLGYEVLSAFFLEASFLGIMLFGHNRVSERVHLLATAMVAIGTTISAFWILSLNSWLQTPAGYTLINNEFHVSSWLAVIFNPSFPYRLTHMLLASGLTCSFLIAGMSAYQQLRGVANAATGKAIRVALTLATILIPLQIFVGDQHGLNTLKHQPQKIAAMEGLWHTETNVPLLLFALPDEKTQSNRFELAIPNAASLVLTHHADGEIRGLNEFTDVHPPVAPVFWGFRVMVGTAMLMLLVSWLHFFLLRKQQWRLEKLSRFSLIALSAMTFSGWLATLAGWYVTEIGRQPFIVYGLVRSKEVASSVPADKIALSLCAYAVIYSFLLIAFVRVVMRLVCKSQGKSGEHSENPSPQHNDASALAGAQ